MTASHVSIEPNILYFGTPVVLVSTSNDDGSANLAPISSAFWLGWRCVLGIASHSKTTRNMLRTRECVLNLPSVREARAVDNIARTTGSNPVPSRKQSRGYVYEPDKFGRSGLTPVMSETVAAPRALECPVQMEAVVTAVHDLANDTEALRGNTILVETRIKRVHVHPDLLMDGHENRIDPDKWSPLIMSFQKFYGLSGQVHPSRLADIPERLYRSPDIDRATSPETDCHRR